MYAQIFTEAFNSTAEITTSTEKEISKVWPEVTYKGDEWFDSQYMAVLKLADKRTKITYDNAQESYTGYIPSKDIFLTGYDMWIPDGGNAAGLVYWEVVNNKPKIISADIDYGSQMMYGNNGAYKKIHKKHSDLIDLRLD